MDTRVRRCLESTVGVELSGLISKTAVCDAYAGDIPSVRIARRLGYALLRQEMAA